MNLISVNCSFCGKKYKKDLNHFNENLKLKQKNFCSPRCLVQSRTKRKTLTCDNPNCNKKFERLPSDILKHNYCSHSCAAKITNLSRTKKIRICPKCKNEFTGFNKYCSKNCIPARKSKYTPKVIISEIKSFAREYKRIPVKKEMLKFYKAARKSFGTWNETIKAAGFDPNPVMFANKHIAKDGHVCDSLSEKIIDDWLFANKIEHKRNVHYPGKDGLTVDFLIRRFWIEFFGLYGEHRRYDELRNKKLRIVRKYKLKLLEIYPKDLFPKNNLKEKFAFLSK